MKVVPLDRLDHVPDEEEELAALLDQIQRDDPELQRLRRRVLRLQRQLRAQTDEETWRLYLRLEETVNERCSLMTKLVARRSELQEF